MCGVVGYIKMLWGAACSGAWSCGLLLTLAACATAPRGPVAPEPQPPRPLSAEEVRALSAGTPVLVSVEAVPVRLYADYPEEACPVTPYLPPALRIDLPFPVRIMPLPSQAGGLTLARLVEPAELRPDPVPICRVQQAIPVVSRGPLLVQIAADPDRGPERRREILLLPEAVELPILRPDYRESADPRQRLALRAVVPMRVPLQTFDGQSLKLWQAAPRSLFVFVSTADPGASIEAGEPSLIIEARPEGALILLADGLLSFSAWGALRTETATVVLPRRSRLRAVFPELPGVIVSQTVRPPPLEETRMLPSPPAQPREDRSTAQLRELRTLPRYQTPPLGELLDPFEARQRPLAARLQACWDATRCSSERSVVLSCQGAPPGQGCDPPSGPLVFHTPLCLPGEPYQTLREAETVRAQSCGHLERELAALMEELRAEVKPAVQRWLDQRLEQGVRAFLEKPR